MKFHPQDFTILRGALITLGLVAFVSLAWVIATRQFQSALSGEKGNAIRTLAAERLQLSNAKQQEAYFSSNTALYQELAKRGLFDAERRLEWIDRVSELRAKHGLFSVEYDVSAQHPLEVATGNVIASASTIDLKVSALHEQAALDFLVDLKASAPGVFVLDSCTMQPVEGLAADTVAARVTAYCTMQWITVKGKRA